MSSVTHDTSYDAQLEAIDHFVLYPSLLPWIGKNYRDANSKLLIIGESHYLKDGSTYHLDPVAWYAGVDLTNVLEKDINWFRTRGTVSNGIATNWKLKSKAIYRNIAKALETKGIGHGCADGPFGEIAYMNYFQRPAQVSGDSIRVAPLDVIRSAEVVAQVVSVLKPDLVIFCTSLGWKAAKSAGLDDVLRSRGITVKSTVHPSSAWWNRPRRNGKNGLDTFLAAIGDRPSPSASLSRELA